MKFTLKKALSDKDREKLNTFSDFSAKILLDRNIADKENAERFLNPKYELSDPLLLPDADKASARIIKAIKVII